MEEATRRQRAGNIRGSMGKLGVAIIAFLGFCLTAACAGAEDIVDMDENKEGTMLNQTNDAKELEGIDAGASGGESGDSVRKGQHCLIYRLPESKTGWTKAWQESEVNIICTYSSETGLTDGAVSVKLNVPVLQGVERTDYYELVVHEADNFGHYQSGSTVEVSYTDGKVCADGKPLSEEDGYYEIPLRVSYDSSLVKNGTDLQIYVKSHCTDPSGAYEVALCDWKIKDGNADTAALLDLSSENVSLAGKMYTSGDEVAYRLAEALTGFHIMNPKTKLAVETAYSLQVYNPENAAVSYHSSDESVAAVDSEGTITALKAGRSKITAVKNDTGEETEITIEVDRPQILLNNPEILLLTEKQYTFTAITEFADKTAAYKWTSADDSVAAVSPEGVAEAKAAGQTTITVEDMANGLQTSFEVEVYQPEDPEGIRQYLSLANTSYVTVDIAKRSYDLIYSVYKDVFDYFNDGEYEPVTLYFTVNDYSPAYSDSQDIYLDSSYMLSNPKDVDCLTHELIHCAQNYGDVGNDTWLMEGLTDYGRYLFGRHNEDCGWKLPSYNASQKYTDSYTVTAAFLKYVTEHYCEDLPHLINGMFKKGGYDASIWETNTGCTLDQLWKDYAQNS